MVRIIVACAALLATAAFGAERPAEQVQDAQLHQLFEEYFERSLELNPLQATFIGDARYNDRLTNDLAPAHRAFELKFYQDNLAAARKLASRALGDVDRLSLEVFIANLETAIEGMAFPSHLIPVNQFSSLPTLMAVLGSGASAQPFATASDYDAFLARMEDYVEWSDQAIVNMKQGMQQGITYPRVLMEKVVPQLSELIADDPAQSVFYKPLERFPDAVSSNDRERLTAAYRRAIVERINPAYRRLRDFVRNEYMKAARASVGWSELPNGQAWYQYLAKLSTTTNLPAQTIHELGVQEVARIRAEMEQVKSQVGFDGDLAAFFKFVQTDSRFYYDSAEALLQGYRELKQKIDARLPKLFSHFPKADYEVREVEAFRAQTSAGASYQSPSADGSRPGIFYINTYNLKAQPKFGMETLSLHEAAPGHHFQIAIQQELTDLPRFRRFGTHYVAYVEGWALYAESLGKELGLFTDPYQYYGRLSDEMLRAMRLVVDTGLHTRGWSRERAIAYMLENSSMAPSDVEAEVERYLAIPGQALGYKIGQFKIRELRTKAEQALGQRFDVREFHSEILRDGALPMDVLARKIDRWIENGSRP